MLLGGVFLALNSIEDHKDKEPAEATEKPDDEAPVLKASTLAPQQRSPLAGNVRREKPQAEARPKKEEKNDAAAAGERARADLERRNQRMHATDRDVATRIAVKVVPPEDR